MHRRDSDNGLHSSIDLPDGVGPACLESSILNMAWNHCQGIGILMYNHQYDSLLAALPLDYITSLTVKGRRPHSKDN